MSMLMRRPNASSLRAGADRPGAPHAATLSRRRRSQWFGATLAALMVLLGLLGTGRTAAAVQAGRCICPHDQRQRCVRRQPGVRTERARRRY